MTGDLAQAWRNTFMSVLQRQEHAVPLKQAALLGKRRNWTTSITATTVAACEAMGWDAAAIGHQAKVLPVPRSEYLALDVMAFSRDPGASRWRFPVAVMELENRQDEDYIAYTLWKLLCVRADLRVLCCYRRLTDEARHLIAFLVDEVVAAMSIAQRMALAGDTVIVVGSRGDAEAFPYGYFKWWRLEANTGRFRLL